MAIADPRVKLSYEITIDVRYSIGNPMRNWAEIQPPGSQKVMREFILFDIVQEGLKRENARLLHEGKPKSNQRGLLNITWDIWRARRGGERDLAARRQYRLANLIAYARARSPFYKDLYSSLPAGIRDHQELPPVSKPELMESFDEWVTDPKVTRNGVEAFVRDTDLVGSYYLDQYAIWTTSGTTGEPGIFVHDGAALDVYAALGLLRGLYAWVTTGNLWAFLRQGVRAAIVIAAGGHWASDAAKEIIRGIHPWLSDRIQTYSVLTPMPEMVNLLNDYQPTILFGYPTALALLARQQMIGELKISPLLVATAAEWLTPGARHQIADAFDCTVRETYAASEFMGIAYSCDHGRLHMNSDWVILEPVDEAYRPVPPGQASQTVLLTNLANRVQPIIRYDLGDSITVDPDPCPCGNPLPTIQVEGRRDDVLYLQTPDSISVPILPMALATVVEEVPGVTRYQIIHTAPTELSLRIEAPPENLKVGKIVAHRLREYLGTLGLPSIQITESPEPPSRDPVSGKYRQFWADFGPEDSQR